MNSDHSTISFKVKHRPLLWMGLKPHDLLKALGNPPDRYRPIPFLAWTGKLDWRDLELQLKEIHSQGIREFILFPIYGMELSYFSAVYWERVDQTLSFCQHHGMKCWIYDEYNWPSGCCGGQLFRDHPDDVERRLWVGPDDGSLVPTSVTAEVEKQGDIRWGVEKDRNRSLAALGADWSTGRGGHLNVLDFKANRDFIQSTHERYEKRFGQKYREVIAGFFTDEPAMHTASSKDGWMCFPYTDDLFPEFQKRFGYDLKEYLRDLVSESDTARATRCQYWQWISERFGEAYSGQQQLWCESHGMALVGHCNMEEFLFKQTAKNGDLWEVLRHFTIPGIDLLCNAEGFNYPYRINFYGFQVDRRAFHLTCKLVHGIVRHSGGREMLSEAYGVCDWGINLTRQRCGFHYQVALGVTFFNDNGLATSIADFRKYAFSGKHFSQPWWPFYHLYAEYNARLAALHAEGEPVAHVAILFPRSTIWSDFHKGGEPVMNPLQNQIYGLLDELIRRQWSFDFIFEPVLAVSTVEDGVLKTEHARYRVLIVPSATDLPQACLKVMHAFANEGGTLIFLGKLPEREVESQTSLIEAMKQMIAGSKSVHHLTGEAAEVCELLGTIQNQPLRIHVAGERDFVSSWRRIAGNDVLFVANMAEAPRDVELTVNLTGSLCILDPDTLQRFRPNLQGGNRFKWHFDPCQAFVILVGETPALENHLPSHPNWRTPAQTLCLDGDWDFSVERGNWMLLSCQARPDPDCRGLTEAWHRDTGSEGWIIPEKGRRLPEAISPRESPWYWVRSSIQCESVEGIHSIVCDNPDFLEVYVNGQCAEPMAGMSLWAEENVWFDVRGLFNKGENWVHARVRTSKYNDPRIGNFAHSAGRLLQPVVILGNFLVQEGRVSMWTGQMNPAKSWEQQGLPNFSGHGIYRRTLRVEKLRKVCLRLPECTDAVEVKVNGMTCGVRSWHPYVFDLTQELIEGENQVEIHVFNTLGNVITETYGGKAPDQYPKSGLLKAPELLSLDNK